MKIKYIGNESTFITSRSSGASKINNLAFFFNIKNITMYIEANVNVDHNIFASESIIVSFSTVQ